MLVLISHRQILTGGRGFGGMCKIEVEVLEQYGGRCVGGRNKREVVCVGGRCKRELGVGSHQLLTDNDLM